MLIIHNFYILRYYQYKAFELDDAMTTLDYEIEDNLKVFFIF